MQYWFVWRDPLHFLLDDGGMDRFNDQMCGQIAQLVEQWTENPRVGSSNLPLANPYCVSLVVMIVAIYNPVIPSSIMHVLVEFLNA